MSSAPARPFPPRFFVMCAFTFTVFLSAFQLLPTAPFRILALGGSPFDAGLFLAFLTYASAFSAPLTGALADRLGRRRVMIGTSLVIAGLSVPYGISRTFEVPLGLALVHGVFWSGLLSASAAYLTDILPEARRAEGIAYWGLASTLAIALAPNLAFWLYTFGWGWVCVVAGGLNLVMTAIAAALPDTEAAGGGGEGLSLKTLIEARVLLVSLTLFLYSFGYGGITSFAALYAQRSGVEPKGLYFSVSAGVTLVTRPFFGRLADRVGPVRVLVPSLVALSLGLALLAVHGARAFVVASAVLFGGGFGAAYPVFVAYVMRHVDPERRGAAFGGILAAFDTGIGTGSLVMGFLIARAGFSWAFAVAAALSALAAPYFVLVRGRLPRPDP